MADTAELRGVDQTLSVLAERRAMERREELLRIGDMGRVEALRHRIDRKLGRNLYQKLNTGPLVKESSSTPGTFDQDFETAAPSNHRHDHRRVSSDLGISYSGEKCYVGYDALRTMTERKKREQSQELADLEHLGVVGRSSSDKIKDHLRNHIHSGFSNHRLMIKPHGSRDSRKKSSILVTMDDVEQLEETQLRNIYRQESKVVIDSFLQMPSRQQRVLEKLSETQIENISKAEVSKTRRVWRRKKYKRKRHSSGAIHKLKAISKSPLEPQSPPDELFTTVTPSLPKHSTFSVKEPPLTLVSRGREHPLEEIEEKPPQPGIEPSLSGPPQPGIKPPSGGDMSQAPPPLAPNLPSIEPPQAPGMEPPLRGEAPAPPTIVRPPMEEETTHILDLLRRLEPSSRVVADGGGAEEREEEGEESDDDISSPSSEFEPATTTLQLGRSLSIASMAVSEAGSMVEGLHWEMLEEDTSSFDLATPSSLATHQQDFATATVCDDAELLDEDMSSPTSSEQLSSLGSSFVSSKPHPPPPATAQRQLSSGSGHSPPVHPASYVSPQLSLSQSAGDFFCQTATHRTNRAYYSSTEVEVNPFALEFQQGLSASGGSGTSEGSSLKHSISKINRSPLPTILTCKTPSPKEIPPKAYQDPKFVAYIKTLDHEADVKDYITYKMQRIGDQIELKYADKLNRAVDEVFYELVKESLSWQTFKAVSTRLLLQGNRVQDGIMLIPAFARQLRDMMPQWSTRIGSYTEEMLHTYAEDHILEMGGWSSLMESYESYEDYVPQESSIDEVQVYYEAQQREQDWVQPPFSPGSAATLPTRKRRRSSGKKYEDPAPHPASMPFTTADATPATFLPTVAFLPQTGPVAPPLTGPVVPPLTGSVAPPLPRYHLRRCQSVEVLLDESAGEEEQVEQEVTSGRGTLDRSQPHVHYHRYQSLQPLDLATPLSATPTFSVSRCAANVVSDYQTPSNTPETSRRNLPTLSEHEEYSRVSSHRSSRRNSASSTIVTFNYTHVEEHSDGGFELVGVQGSEVRVQGGEVRLSHLQSTESSASFVYMENHYSSIDGTQEVGAGPGVTPPTSEAEGEPIQQQGPRAERRRSSVGEILPLAAVAAVHLIPLGLYYFTQS